MECEGARSGRETVRERFWKGERTEKGGLAETGAYKGLDFYVELCFSVDEEERKGSDGGGMPYNTSSPLMQCKNIT